MGSALFGGMKSGTPIETQGGTQQMAQFFQSLMGGQNGPGGFSDLIGRMTSDSMQNMMGFDPTSLGLEQAFTSMLTDPTDATAGLFRSMVPFEQEQTATQVGGMRDMFGSMGGRFGRNIAQGEADLRGNLAAEFGRNREQALLAAAGQQMQGALGIGGLMNQARGQAFQEQMMPWQMMQQFFQPGAPIYQEGMLPGLLGLGGTYLLGRQMRGGGNG